jgi:hypothetical protein
METKNIFSAAYRQDYFEGYSKGLNPFLQLEFKIHSEAFTSGFTSGREDYEQMNGRIVDGIPKRIVTNKVLEDFLVAGLLGLSFNTDGYTAFQLNIISQWYQSGTEKYDPNQSIYLFAILESNGIAIHSTSL